MTEKDIKLLESTVNDGYRNANDPLWVEAFDTYNKAHPNQRPLGMACRPCYMKVLNFMKTSLNDKPLITSSIKLENVKDSDGWWILGSELGFTNEKHNKVFEYGEFASLELVVDEKLNIVGGKIIPKEPLDDE